MTLKKLNGIKKTSLITDNNLRNETKKRRWATSIGRVCRQSCKMIVSETLIILCHHFIFLSAWNLNYEKLQRIIINSVSLRISFFESNGLIVHGTRSYYLFPSWYGFYTQKMMSSRVICLASSLHLIDKTSFKTMIFLQKCTDFIVTAEFSVRK